MHHIRFATCRTACAAALACWIPGALAASGPVAEKPVLRPGDEWRFAAYYSLPSREVNRIWLLTAVDASRVLGTENGEPLELTPELNVRESPRATESNPRSLAFPLEVGKRWRYDSEWLFKPKSSRGGGVFDVSVVGHETVAVPAGEFDAFKLVAEGRLHGTSPAGSLYDARTTTTYWYAPRARAIVKWMHHNPYLGPSAYELVEFRPAQSAAEPRISGSAETTGSTIGPVPE